MHVHANYSEQLASLGASREETQEIALRRAAEVRKRLSAASSAMLSEIGEEVSRTTPRDEERRGTESRNEEVSNEELTAPQLKESDGRLFSVRA